jgi:MoaA/NifB/PqqE/SkfB family radical SAM enzyme
MAQTAGPTCGYRVVQVHPLLTCNLRCLHCYSTSSPAQRQSLSLEKLCSALEILRREGFNGVSISGGEPLLYSDLAALLRHIRSLGMLATVTTNAMLLDDERAAMVREGVDLVAVSVDGPPEFHNRLRGHPHAFERMSEGVGRLRGLGIPFAFIFTLTLHNLHQLEWVAGFAVAQKAGLLQVHPLEEVGRAAGELPGAAPDDLELARGFVEVARLQKLYSGKLSIQYDVADLEVLRRSPERAYAEEPPTQAESLDGVKLADLIAPVIIEADGAIVPLQYNFGRAYQLADIHSDVSERLETWKKDFYPEFAALCRRVYKRLLAPDKAEFPFVNWYSEILQASHAAGLVQAN